MSSPRILSGVLSAVLLLSPVFLHAHERLEESIARLTSEIESSPGDGALYLRRAELHRLHRDWKKAAADYDAALEADPTLTQVAVARAQMLLESDRPREALATLAGAIEAQPSAARQVRARVYLSLDRPGDAARDWEAVLDTATPPDPGIALKCAQAWHQAGENARALDILNQVGDQLGSIPGLQEFALELEVQLGQYQVALTRIDRLTAASPRPETWHARRAVLLEQIGRRAEAAIAWRDARAALDQVPGPRRQTAASLELSNSIDQALTRLGSVTPSP